MRSTLARLSLVLAVTALACSSSNTQNSGFSHGNGSNGGNGDGTGDDGTGQPAPGPLGPIGDGGGSTQACAPNPANYDIPGNGCDDDADGKVDNAASCDSALSATGDAVQFAKALGLCQQADATHWGVVSATYTNGHKSAQPGDQSFDQQHGILPKFGDVVKPREGQMLGVLSSGSASEFDSDFQQDGVSVNGAFKGAKNGMQTGGGDAPTGFPKPAQGCTNAKDVHDVIDVKLSIKVPANAKGLSFDFDFWSGEWPEYVCTNFNDAFIAYLSSTAFNAGKPDNMSFDSKGNPVSVNNGFFDRCTPNVTTGCIGGNSGTSVCPGGEAELKGTGFYDPGTYCPLNQQQSSGGGATGWLTSQAPVQGGETITLELMIWDTGDNQYDSSVLVDNFQWVPNPVTTGTTRPPPK